MNLPESVLYTPLLHHFHNALHLLWPPSWSIIWHLGPNLANLDNLMIFFRGQKTGFVTIGGQKRDQFAHAIALLGPTKGPCDPEMGQWCLSSNSWRVCSVWNRTWCHKDLQRGKSALYGVLLIMSWFPPYCGSTCSFFTMESLPYKNDSTEGCIRLNQERSYHYSDFMHWFGLAFSDIRYIPLWGSI